MPPKPPVQEASQFFLSATAQDCKDYREAIQHQLETYIENAKIYLQENWALGGRFVVDVCESKVKECHCYFGLFGYRYGWIPPGHTKSITELEFGWAVERWRGKREQPIFILLPEKGSESEKYLQETAQQCHDVEFADDNDKKTQSISAQLAFIASIKEWAAERVLVFYRDREQLLGKAQSCVQNWNLDLYRKALDSRRTSKGGIPDDELGRIGRVDHINALHKVIETFDDHDAARMVAILAHGPENHGQMQFYNHLASIDNWDGMQVYTGQAIEADSPESIIHWVCGNLGEPTVGKPDIHTMAKLLATRLEKTSLVFMFGAMGRMANRIANFHANIWQPLFDAITTSSIQGKYHMYWFLFDHEVLEPGVASGAVCHDIEGDHVDYSKLLVLPPLSTIKRAQVKSWLKDLSGLGIKLQEYQREEIATRAVDPDGHPANVYNRLNLLGFWNG